MTEICSSAEQRNKQTSEANQIGNKYTRIMSSRIMLLQPTHWMTSHVLDCWHVTQLWILLTQASPAITASNAI